MGPLAGRMRMPPSRAASHGWEGPWNRADGYGWLGHTHAATQPGRVCWLCQARGVAGERRMCVMCGVLSLAAAVPVPRRGGDISVGSAKCLDLKLDSASPVRCGDIQVRPCMRPCMDY